MTKTKQNLALREIELLNEQKKHLVNLPHLYGWPWYKWAKEFFDSRNRLSFLCAGNQLSKMISASEDIPTPSGFKKMGDIRVGDFVLGRDGKPTKVIDIPFEGEDLCFAFTFNDGSVVVASKDHEWICKGKRERFVKNYRSNFERSKGKSTPNENYKKWVVKSTLDIIKSGGYDPEATAPKRHVVPICDPVHFEEKKLEVAPYFIGLLIGDGSLNTNSVTLTINEKDLDIVEYLETKQQCGKFHAKQKNSFVMRAKVGTKEKLEELGLLGKKSYEKEIPEHYLFSSVAQRKELLAGLMDTDGTIDLSGQSYNYSTTSKVLSGQVLSLVCSLGGNGHIKQYPSYYYDENDERVDCRDHYVVTIWTTFNPFNSLRKAMRWTPKRRYAYERVIKSIECIGTERSRCITVDNEDGSFLCTKNYIVTHNSSSQIRKMIHWATCPELWPQLWHEKQRPLTFWYLYPTKELAHTEFTQKWEPEFLPRGEMKEHPIYGWRVEKRDRWIWALHFNSGITVFFKTYAQDVQHLQAGSVWYVAADEELPYELFPELAQRTKAVRGYFSMVFTATLGQIEWKDTIETRGRKEKFPQAAKWQVSMYDCQEYIDGTKSIWTNERIEEEKALIGDPKEIERRIYGKFVVSSGLKYPGFSRDLNVKQPMPLETYKSWHIYSGVDIGSGLSDDGKKGHPSAIVFVAVRPDFRYARVFRGWRGDNEQTTAGDVIQKYITMSNDLVISQHFYDWHNKDFQIIGQRAGISFEPAEKGHETGETTLNTLFKNGMLDIDDLEELEPLIYELCSVLKETAKTKAKDDFSDALRYSCTKVPFDYGAIRDKIAGPVKPQKVWVETDSMRIDRERLEYKKMLQSPNSAIQEAMEDEIQAWNELYDV